MAGDTTPAFNRLAGRIALRIAAIYLVLGVLWIALSDRALMALVDDPRTLTWLQTIKGWAYVTVTALLLYALVFWQTRRVARANEALEERDRHITRLNRVYAMLNAINGAILRIRHRDTLLNETCRIAVEKGGFPLAWVGLAEGDGTRVHPVSSAGEGLDCLDGLVLRIDPGDPDAHPMAPELTAGRPFVIEELADVPPMDACHARARELGFRSVAVVPIMGQSRLMGVMGFFVRERRGPAGVVFDEGELQLLTELAADTGIGLTLIEQGDALDRAARFDPLTGLANRSLLEERIGQALMRAGFQRRSVGVMALEVIGLRSLVDSLGRQQGDRLQQVVAARLVNRVREGDTVAYLGNGEFAVLLADVRTGLDVSEVAEKKLLPPFEMELDPGAPPLVVKLSAGAAVFPGDADTPEGLLQCAGVALHQGGAASHAGRCVFYAPEMDEQVREYQMLDNELHGALERGEMTLHFQPIVHLDSGEIIGMEALLRWDNRRFGPVAPDRFIPIAENSGLIRSLGDWVLDTACAQIVHWRERGWPRLAVSVNLSVRQLLAPGFDERVREIVMRHRLDPDDMPLVLEVTETAVIEDMEAVSAALDRLKRLGIAVHLDDFGTGYASLSYLQQLPVDALKIDKSFVQNLESDPVAENLVRSVIVLAQGLELALVAEGVETPGQRDKLMELGCDVGQGYLYARPQPVDEVERLLADSLRSVEPGPAERY